jgi:hypothetical protein
VVYFGTLSLLPHLITLIHAHTHTHTLQHITYFLSETLHSHTLTHSTPHSHTLYTTLSHTAPHSHTLTHTFTHCTTLSHTLTHSHTLHCHFSHTLSHTHIHYTTHYSHTSLHFTVPIDVVVCDLHYLLQREDPWGNGIIQFFHAYLLERVHELHNGVALCSAM